MEKKYKYLLLFSLFLFAVGGGILLWWLVSGNHRTEIIFLNIGQGDAILITQGSNQVLIDSGKSGKELLSRLGRHIPFWDRHIEMAIATHPDTDHIGGFPALLKAYTVERVLTTGAASDTETSRLFEEAIEKYTKEKKDLVFRGTTLDFPYGGKFEIQYPHAPLLEKTEDTNQGSIVARFIYGETSFLLTGDLAKEETLLPEEKETTVLKVAHHGSKYSSSQEFLERISPEEAVISVGKNSYGHPDTAVLERLRSIGAVIRRTDEGGDIRYRCSKELQKCSFVK